MWFVRSFNFGMGKDAGIFTFIHATGKDDLDGSFRVLITIL